MKQFKLSTGKLINELKLIELGAANQRVELRFLIDCLTEHGVKP